MTRSVLHGDQEQGPGVLVCGAAGPRAADPVACTTEVHHLLVPDKPESQRKALAGLVPSEAVIGPGLSPRLAGGCHLAVPLHTTFPLCVSASGFPLL